MMKANVGGMDKNIRLIAGIAVIIAGVVMQSWWGVIGVVLAGTALIGVCPAYLPFGINSAKESE